MPPDVGEPAPTPLALSVVNYMHTPRFLASALVALWLGGLHRFGGRGAKRLRARDIPALLERDDTLIVDTETTGVGRGAEVIEVVAIDTTGALRLSALSLPVGPISHESWKFTGSPSTRSTPKAHARGPRSTKNSRRCCGEPGAYSRGVPISTPGCSARPPLCTTSRSRPSSGPTCGPRTSTPDPEARTPSPTQCAGSASGGKDDTTAPKPTAGRCSH